MQARPGHILVVDDDELNRSLLIKNLEHAGHRTSAAENGFAAFPASTPTLPTSCCSTW